MQLGPLAAGGEGAQGDAHLPGGGHGGARKVQHRRDAPLLQQVAQVIGPDLSGAQQQHGAAGGPVVLQIADRRLQAAAVGGELLGVDRHQPSGSQGVTGGGEGVLHHHRELLQRGVQLLAGERQPGILARQQPCRQQGFLILLELQQHSFDPLVHPAALAQKHHRVFGQIVHAGADLRVHGGQIPVQAAGDGAGAEVLRVLAQLLGGFLRLWLFRQLLRQRLQPLPKARETAGGAVGQHLCRRQDLGGGDVFRPPLGTGVEGAHGVDLIVKELTPHRLVHQGGEHVQDAAPQGELSHALHLLAAGIPGGHQAVRQLVQIRPGPHLQRQRQGMEQLGRQRPGAQCVRGGHRHRRLAPGKGIQRRQTAALPVPGGDGAGPQLPLPAQQHHRLRAQQRLQIAPQLLGLPLVAADEHRRPLRRQGHRRAHAGAVHRLQAGDRHRAAALFHPPDQLRHLGNGMELFEKLFHSCKSL